MALPATPLSVGAGTATVLDVDSVLKRLPADARAQLAWAKRPIEVGVARLRTEPLTDELVEDAADRVLPAIQALAHAGLAFASSADDYRAALMQDLQVEQERLGEFVQSEDARDTLWWIVSLLQSFYALTSLLPPEQFAKVEQSAWEQATTAPEMKPWWRGFVALMAAAEEAKRGSSPPRARELLEVAFLQLTEFRNLMRRHGVPFPAFPFETTDQRRERLRHYAAHLRSVLSEEDASVLDSARLRAQPCRRRHCPCPTPIC